MSEHTEQVALFRWSAMRANTIPALRMLLAVPNGGHRNKITAARLKAEGVRAGAPDIVLPVPSGIYASLWIELKRPKTPGKAKGVTSELQLQWLGDLQSYGNCVGVCYGWDEARILIESYLRADS